jgi:hypothetical protein
MKLETYQKFVNFSVLHAEVLMGGNSAPHQSVFLENVWECQLHFRVMERKSCRKNNLSAAKQEKREELWTDYRKIIGKLQENREKLRTDYR